MKCFLICTHKEDFWPVEEIGNEGDVHQSIEEHCQIFGEEHRPAIRVFFPEHVTDRLSEADHFRLEYNAETNFESQELLDLYDNTIR